jgi:hypothetical protein
MLVTQYRPIGQNVDDTTPKPFPEKQAHGFPELQQISFQRKKQI